MSFLGFLGSPAERYLGGQQRKPILLKSLSRQPKVAQVTPISTEGKAPKAANSLTIFLTTFVTATHPATVFLTTVLQDYSAHRRLRIPFSCLLLGYGRTVPNLESLTKS
ncbi:hypothetical protein KM043_005391 [Ampulex compressa]|nr:hypothetical protein KM043_005391 [Ampulex compressa]